MVDLVGPAGPQGIQGVQGVPGVDGPTGAQGPAGPQGARGITGVAGTVWLKGIGAPSDSLGLANDWYLDTASGDMYGPKIFVGEGSSTWGPSFANLSGDDGAIGPVGPAGANGAVGPTGPQGIQGVQGPIGLTGANGAMGPQGPIGLTGNTGPQGPIGNTGATGPQGPIGNTGPTGAAGRGITSIDISSGELEVAYSDFTFDILGNVVGPQGPAGATGPQGIQGETGPAGADGDDGIQGIQGPAGEDGMPGDIGPTGPQGPAGDTGPQGPAGADGATGPAGANGSNGTVTHRRFYVDGSPDFATDIASIGVDGDYLWATFEYSAQPTQTAFIGPKAGGVWDTTKLLDLQSPLISDGDIVLDYTSPLGIKLNLREQTSGNVGFYAGQALLAPLIVVDSKGIIVDIAPGTPIAPVSGGTVAKTVIADTALGETGILFADLPMSATINGVTVDFNQTDNDGNVLEEQMAAAINTVFGAAVEPVIYAYTGNNRLYIVQREGKAIDIVNTVGTFAGPNSASGVPLHTDASYLPQGGAAGDVPSRDASGNITWAAPTGGGGGTSLPDGGTTGQILAKVSNTDGDADWVDAPSGGGGGSFDLFKTIVFGG